MSTKCTVLIDNGKNGKKIWYHFYWDYEDDKYHFEYLNKKSFEECIMRIGEILEGCPFSDSGIYAINLKNNKTTKLKQKPKCYKLDSVKKRLKK